VGVFWQFEVPFWASAVKLGCVNPVALITGASRGIGRGIALELARSGHDLVINYAGNAEAAVRTAADCRAAGSEAGHDIRAEPCQADISVAADRERLIGFTRSAFGRLDLLVNNAGVAPAVRADLLEATEASFDRLLAVNVKGPYFLTQLAARWMIEQFQPGPAGEPEAPTVAVQSTTAVLPASSAEVRPPSCVLHPPPSPGLRCPSIVTVTSISTYTASVNRGDYCVSKAALAMLTPLYAARLAEFGIRVYEIRPGIIATDMTGPVREKYDTLIREGLTPLRRWGQPEDIGRAVAAIAAGALPFSTGEVINVDGGFHLRRL
jgi:3-oxoacyl-[acyl-carrier protein] reductase